MINASPIAGVRSRGLRLGGPPWYKRAVFYEVLVRGFKDSNGDGTGDLRGLIEKLGLPRVARRRLPVAAAAVRVAAARRRLRHLRLHEDPSGLRGPRGLRPADRVGARARPAHHHRPGDEPHQRPASLVPGVPARPRGPVRRLLRLVRRPDRLPRRADHLHRRRGVQLDLRPGPQAVLLAPLLPPPAGPELRQPGRAGGHAGGPAVLARPRHRRLPPGRRALPVRAGGHRVLRPAGDARLPEEGPRRGGPPLPRPGAAGRGQRLARGRRRVLRRPHRRRRRVPHGLPLPADAAHLHGGKKETPRADLRDHVAHAEAARDAPSGASSCATTTS